MPPEAELSEGGEPVSALMIDLLAPDGLVKASQWTGIGINQQQAFQ